MSNISAIFDPQSIRRPVELAARNYSFKSQHSGMNNTFTIHRDEVRSSRHMVNCQNVDFHEMQVVRCRPSKFQ